MVKEYIHPLDAAVSIQPSSRQSDRCIKFEGAPSPDYQNINGQLGGITAATMLNGALQHPEATGTPVCFTNNFCEPMADERFEIAVRLDRGGRHTQFLSIRMRQRGNIIASASAVLSTRRNSWSHHPARAPSVPSSIKIDPAPVGTSPQWLNRYQFRFVEGLPDLSPREDGDIRSAKSILWINDWPIRPLDHLSLLGMSDVFFLRLLQVRGTFPPMSTVSMTTYFHASPDEIAAEGEGAVLGVADARVFHAGFHDQCAELWSKDGRLLVSSTQIVWFRD